MDESRPTRGVSVSAGRMTIEGVSERFVQGIGRHVAIEATQLRLTGGFAHQEGRLEDAARILGRARLAQDSLHRAGHDGEAGEMSLAIRPFAAGQEARMLLTLGPGAGEDDIQAEVMVAPAVFEALKSDLLAGAADTLSLTATTSLWAREADRDAGAHAPIAWYLGLDADGATIVPARGLVETLVWSPAPAVQAATAEVAHRDERELEHEQDATTPEQLGAINRSLKQLLLILAFLLIVIALK